MELADIEEADNGLALLECLRSRHIDLALVDICMPAMTGLEAIREAKALSPGTDFYILSGFNDFKYAQEAVRLNVCDYFLKPICRNDLEEVMEKTISRLEQDKIQLTKELKLSVVSLMNAPENPLELKVPCHPVLVANDSPTKKTSFRELFEWNNEKFILFASDKKEYAGGFLRNESPALYKRSEI